MIAIRLSPTLGVAREHSMLLALLFICQASSAQEPIVDTTPTLEQITVDQELLPMEELTVTAPRSLSSMRAMILDAEEDVLTVFNSLNQDSDYDIRCRRETPIGSNISVRVCTPRFVDREVAKAEQDFLAGLGYFDPTGIIRTYEAVLLEKMIKLVTENPELYQAMLKYYQLKTGYDEERTERSEDGFFSR